MALSRILVGTDFSDRAEFAAHHAMVIARHTGAEVILMHAMVLGTEEFSPPYAFELPGLFEDKATEIIARSRRRLEDERSRLLGQGVELSHVFVNEAPEKGIVSAAEKSKANLIVLGTHGREGLRRFLVGSVAQRVVHRAGCDVLVAREAPADNRYSQILVAIDFSKQSEMALQRALELVERGGQISLLHCWTIPGSGRTYWGPLGPALRTAIHESANKQCQALVDTFQTSDVEIVFSCEEGNARHIIIERLDAGAQDLVILGSHGRQGVSRLVLGSVAESVLAHAHHSVYIARC